MPSSLLHPRGVRPTTEEQWARYHDSKDIRLRNRIALDNKKLVVTLAQRQRGNCAEPLEDLVQIGFMGLLKAIEKFDPHKGHAFSSFAVPYIVGEIQHFLRDRWGLVKIDRLSFERAGQIRSTARKHSAEITFSLQKAKQLGRDIQPEMLAAAIAGIPANKARYTLEAVQRKPVADIDDQHHLGADDDSLDAQERELLKERLADAIANLPGKQRTAVTLRKYLTAKKTASKMGVKEAEVEALLAEARKTLEAVMRKAA